MKQLLLVSATAFEIEPLVLFLREYRVPETGHFRYGNLDVEICITKVGMVNTAFELGKRVGKRYDVVVNAGVAGSFGKQALGEVVNVTADCFSELGAEDDA